MTWEYQSTISERIHRVIETDGRSVWGIVSGGFDEDASGILGSADVDLPMGRRTLLLVPACPGGLVLDAVRAYQGLREAELTTLFLGIVDELDRISQPEKRLTLGAFGLDASGRPLLIPGISTSLATSPRRALGEMLYHAAYGSPWTECLLPVNLALAEASSTLRSTVSDLLADSPLDSSLGPALAEVAAAMRGLARPAPLPLVPADRDLAPETALTARLRAVSGRAVTSDSGSSSDRGKGTVRQRVIDGERRIDRERPTAGASQPSTGDPGAHAAQALRAASRRSRRKKHRRRRRRNPVLSAWAVTRMRDLLVQLRGSFGQGPISGWMIAAAVGLTLVGGVVVWTSWPAQNGGDERQVATSATASAKAEASGKAEASAADETENGAPTSNPTTEEVTDILAELSDDRAHALSRGDAEALRELTVPGSAAAAADELIDHSVFAGGDYTIEVDSVQVLSAEAERIVASAQMHSHAGSGDTSEDFGTISVEFELKRFDDHWRVEQVTETGDGGDDIQP